MAEDGNNLAKASAKSFLTNALKAALILTFSPWEKGYVQLLDSLEGRRGVTSLGFVFRKA